MPFLAGAAAAGGAGAAGAGAAGAGAAGLGAAGAAGAGAAGAGALGAGAAGAGAAGAGAGLGAAGVTGAGVTAGGLGSGAIGTGMTGAGLAAAPSVAMPALGGGAAGGGGILSGLSSAYNAAQPYINTGSQIYDMIKPNGSLSQGDISAIAKQGAQLYSGLGGGSDRTKLPGPISSGQRDILHGMSLNPLGGDTLGEKFSLSGGNPMTKEQFDVLSPEMRQALLKIVAGR